MSWSVDDLPRSKSIAEDLHSMGTGSNSDTKSHDTIFSRIVPIACHTPYHSTPSHSRPSTPPSSQAGSKDIDADLRGIGYIPVSHSSGLESKIPGNFGHRIHLQPNSAINFHYIDSSAAPATVTRTLKHEKGDSIMDYQDNSPSSSGTSPYMGRSPNPIDVDKLLTNLSNADTFSWYDGLSGSDTSSVEEDLDLEKSADDALSQWFGISLRRLIRPIRVIYAFEQVKQQCAGILQDEGHHLPDSRDEQDCNDAEDVQMDPYDAGEGSGPTRGGWDSEAKASTSSTNDISQSSDSGDQTGSPPESYVKVRGKYKKRRIEGELSCPYRKRNPIRFNVRDHEKCANTSYPTMSQLKKHLTSIHFKNDTCTRCGRQIPLGHSMLAHYQQCPYPPQPQMGTQHINPEDGFNNEVECRLKTRGGKRRVEEWPDLYKLLFPDDETIPEPATCPATDFVPVVEDHEVFLSYERTKPDWFRDVDILVAQKYHIIPESIRHLLARDIKTIFENAFDNRLARPMSIPRNMSSQQSRLEPEMQGDQLSESEFFYTREGVTDIGDGSASLCFDTPRYTPPDDSQGESQESTGQQLLSRAEHMNFLLAYSTTPQASTEMFGQPHPVETSNTPGLELQPGQSHYVRPPSTHDDVTMAIPGPIMWSPSFQNSSQSSVPFRDGASLPGDIHPPVSQDSRAAGANWEFSDDEFWAIVHDVNHL
ncbi:hypothetical protein F5Y05DRAFT_414181 [Hypoxylon sp. FL0543]|nr:hypothetical protein F5Y05DRAFT_414181 [Hypoxylon sp. FL0543]